jgi:hypothetical protein
MKQSRSHSLISLKTGDVMIYDFCGRKVLVEPSPIGGYTITFNRNDKFGKVQQAWYSEDQFNLLLWKKIS